MAMLEVHDGQGRVVRLTVSREQTLMFGSSPKADVVVTDPGIHPFHARLSWHHKKKAYRIEASPEVEYLLVNGRKMLATNLKMGDEIEVGGHHVFVVHLEDDPASTPAVSPRDDRTRVQAPPKVKDVPPAPLPRMRSLQRQEGGVATADDDLDKALKRSAVIPSKGAEKAAPPARGWKRLFYLFTSKANAPGQEEVLSSPLVFGLFVTFVVLVLVGFVLYGIIVRTTATRLYDQAMDNLNDGDYRNAIARFDEFVKANPEDTRIGSARVHRALANVRQYASSSGASWSLALEAEKAMIEEFQEESSFKDASAELDELVLKTGEALADRAKAGGDPRVLAEAESILPLHGKLAGSEAESFLKRSLFPAKIDAARAAVKKAGIRSQALAAMDAAVKEGKAGKVYAARDRLVELYGDQSQDAQVIARMTQANDLIRKAVAVDPSSRPAETEPYPELIGPRLTLVLRSPATDSKPAANGPLVFALSEGTVVGLDGTTGAPLWQKPLGSSPFPPLPVPGGSSLIVFDAIRNELVKLEGSTGNLIWRQGLGERVNSPPLILGNQIIQSSPAGKLFFLDVATGELKATMNLGLPLSTPPISDESGGHLYINADHDALFVLNRDPLSCIAVEYLGHETGTIVVPPARVGRYLVIPENSDFENGRWRIFLLDERGEKLKQVQELKVNGWTWGTPSAVGSVIWSSGDRGSVAAFGIGSYEEKVPFREIARTSTDNAAPAPAYTITRTERDLLVSAGRTGRFELDPEAGKIRLTWSLVGAGPATAPPQFAGNLVVMTQQNQEGPGTTLWGLEPKTGKLAWRTTLGIGWPAPVRVTPDGRSLSTFTVDGQPLLIPKDRLSRTGGGGFVTSGIPGPGSFRLPADPLARFDGDGWTAIVPALKADRIWVRVGDGVFQERALPTGIGAAPIVFRGGIVLPGDDGRVYLIDPKTGESLAEPFIPPFDRTRPTRWKRPHLINDDSFVLADEAGHVRKIEIVSDPRLRLVSPLEMSLGKDLRADPSALNNAIVVVTDDSMVRSLSTRDLSSIGSWPLKAPLIIPVAVVGDRIAVADSLGHLLMIDKDGQRLWERHLEGATLIGPPSIVNEKLWCPTREGVLLSLAIGDGTPLDRLVLENAPRGQAILLGDRLVVPTGLGTLQLLEPQPPADGNPPAEPSH